MTVEFDGVMQNSDVWINGVLLGHRPYGYVSFSYELTGHLNFGGDNIIAARALDGVINIDNTDKFALSKEIQLFKVSYAYGYAS